MRSSMRLLAWLSAAALACGAMASGSLAVSACGEDEGNVILRPDAGGGDALSDAPSGEGTLKCGVAVPSTYVSASFASNVGVEVALAQRYDALLAKMEATENAGAGTATGAELKSLYNEGAPSLRSISTTATQQSLDALFDAFGDAFGKTWTPADAESDGGVVDGGADAGADAGAPSTTGGKYNGTFYFTQAGVDVRAVTAKMLLGGAFYNHVLAIVQAPLSDAAIDQLVASFGATTAFANRGDDAGASSDRLLAAFAAHRDDKATATPSQYRKMKSALLQMKAATAGGDKCNADRDAAIAAFLLEWEKTTYASAIFALSAAQTSAANPTNGPQTLRAFGDALGFVQSFRGLTPEKRKITDAQIDEILNKMNAAAPYKLVTNAGGALALSDAINLIALYEGFASADVEAFKKTF